MNAVSPYTKVWVVADQVFDALPDVGVHASVETAKARASEIVSNWPEVDLTFVAEIEAWEPTPENNYALTVVYDEDESAAISIELQHVQP